MPKAWLPKIQTEGCKCEEYGSSTMAVIAGAVAVVLYHLHRSGCFSFFKFPIGIVGAIICGVIMSVFCIKAFSERWLCWCGHWRYEPWFITSLGCHTVLFSATSPAHSCNVAITNVATDCSSFIIEDPTIWTCIPSPALWGFGSLMLSQKMYKHPIMMFCCINIFWWCCYSSRLLC